MIASGTQVCAMFLPPQMGAMMAIVIGHRTRKYNAERTEPAANRAGV